MFPHPDDVLRLHRHELRRLRREQEFASAAARRRQTDDKDVLRSGDRDAR